jgi:hypothetical protein
MLALPLAALVLVNAASAWGAGARAARAPALVTPTPFFTSTVGSAAAWTPMRASATATASAQAPAASTARATPSATARPDGSATWPATPSGTPTLAFAARATATPTARATAPPAGTMPPAGWRIRSVDTMKLSRDTLKAQLTDAQIAADVRLDTRLHLTHIAVDVYYDDPAYMARWVRIVRASGLHVWFRAHWYAWEDHGDQRGSMSPHEYIEATRRFLQQHATLLANGDIFDFCSEPENGAYWLRAYGNGWSWRNSAAKSAFNTFIRSGIYMASTTLAHRGRGGVLVTVISVNPSIAERMLSKPTVQRMGMLTLDLYPEGTTRDPATATQRLLAEIAQVRRRWPVPVLLGEHGYARDQEVDDATQARVLAAEMAALARLPYLLGQNYWVDAGGPGYGGYTNLYRRAGSGWTPRPAAAVLAQAYAGMARL